MQWSHPPHTLTLVARSPVQVHRADVQQVKMAGALIDALTFPADELTGTSTFDCYTVRNPFLQRAYDSIEVSKWWVAHSLEFWNALECKGA